eukprot:147899-Amorphochlora_amoeboformis.AAC.2
MAGGRENLAGTSANGFRTKCLEFLAESDRSCSRSGCVSRFSIRWDNIRRACERFLQSGGEVPKATRPPITPDGRLIFQEHWKAFESLRLVISDVFGIF